LKWSPPTGVRAIFWPFGAILTLVCVGDAQCRVWLGNTTFSYLQDFLTGATGLEPATSGVTGGSGITTVGDDGRAIALFIRLSGFLAIRFRMGERSRFQRFAARLLPRLDAETQTIMWVGIFFFASAGASAAYLTVSETWPIEIRAEAIAVSSPLPRSSEPWARCSTGR
jgi:hypothetical protein